MTMDPYQKFSWCIRILRVAFKVIQRDIFEKETQISKMIFRLIMLNYLLYFLGAIYTYNYYGFSTALDAGPAAFGVWEVRTQVLRNHLFDSSSDILLHLLPVYCQIPSDDGSSATGGHSNPICEYLQEKFDENRKRL